jgi:type IV secretion system protein VirB6
MFTAWCGHCLNYILLNVMYTISFGFLMAMLQRFTVIDPVKVSIVDVISMVAVIAIALALIEQVGTLCSSLTGGVGLNGMAAASGTAGFLARASGMKALAGGMKKGLGGWAGNKAQKAIQSAKSQFGQGKGQIRGG